MSKRVAVIDSNNAVVNTCVVPDTWAGKKGEWQPPKNCTAVASDTANIGDIYDGQDFTTPVITKPAETQQEKLIRLRSEAISAEQEKLIMAGATDEAIAYQAEKAKL